MSSYEDILNRLSEIISKSTFSKKEEAILAEIRTIEKPKEFRTVVKTFGMEAIEKLLKKLSKLHASRAKDEGSFLKICRARSQIKNAGRPNELFL